jgi:hypothetical protein
MRNFSGFIWVMIGTSSSSIEHNNKIPGPIKEENFDQVRYYQFLKKDLCTDSENTFRLLRWPNLSNGCITLLFF